MSHLPKSYLAAVFEAKDAPLTLKKMELKMPQPGQVLVKVIATGVCHSDTVVQSGVMGSPYPTAPGHETIGDIVATGDGEKKWMVGMRVGAPWHGGHDNTCKRCQRGLFQMCDNQMINGVWMDGGYGEYVMLRSEAVVRVPDDIDPIQFAPILCAGVTVFNSMRKQNITFGELVAIQGLGGLGHLAIQYANKMGYRTVALSHGDKKRQFALDLGAHEYIDTSKEDANERLQAMGGAAMIVATAPNSATIGPLMGGLQANGRLLVLAPSGMIELNTIPLVMKGITVCGYPSGHALDCEEALAFTKLHGVKCMVETFPLREAQKAWDQMTSGAARFRSVIVMDK